jgi:hypothetical protein
MDRKAIAAIEKLPELARSKLRDLELLRMAAEDSARSATGRLGSLPRDADPKMHERLEVERAKQARNAGLLQQLNSKIMQCLAELPPNAVLEMAPASAVELKPGENPTAALATLRTKIDEVQRDLAKTKRAPMPLSDQSEAAMAYVAQLIRQGRPKIGVVGDRLRVNFRGDMFAPEDVLSLVSWLSPDLVCTAIERELASQPERSDAMPVGARLKRVAELEASLLELERQEEALIGRANADGFDVLRRSDASPLCVLGLAIKQMVQAVA